MKKLLLATAAVMALSATAAHAEVKLDLGGYFKAYAGYSDQDTAGVREFDMKRKSQVFFTGETTLDNGLTVGYNGQLMNENNFDAVTAPVTDSSSKLEQSYVYFSGNWGRVNVGRENGAAYLLQVAAPAADANIDGMDADFSFYNHVGNVREDYKQSGPRVNAAGTTFDARDQQYADKITYITPKFNGFQAGVSYSPSYKTVNNSYSPVAVAGANPGYFGMETDGDVGDLEHFIEGAARYDGEFNGVGMHFGAGYAHADEETGVAGSDDFDQWNAGAKFTWESFGFGANYTADEGSVAGFAGSSDIDTWLVGADYTYGAYTFGVSYLNSEGDSLVAVGDDELDRWTVGAGYTFGPGMKFNGSVGFYDGETAGAAIDNEATVVQVGTDIQF